MKMRRLEHLKHSTSLLMFIVLIMSPHSDAVSCNVSQIKSEIFDGLQFNYNNHKDDVMLPKIFVWYASYGSNMNMERFLCYIEGGKVAGMQKPCEGSKDKTRPTRTLWSAVPHRMFFGRNKTKTWGNGGVAFLDLKRHDKYTAYIRLYKINLQQFNDVLKQENNAKHVMTYPLFGWADLMRIKHQGYIVVGALKTGWYSTVQYLGTVENLPLLTFTCPPWKLKDFKTGKLPICAPSKAYKDVIIKALVEEGKVQEEKAIAYVRDSYEIPLKGSNPPNSSCCNN